MVHTSQTVNVKFLVIHLHYTWTKAVHRAQYNVNINMHMWSYV